MHQKGPCSLGCWDGVGDSPPLRGGDRAVATRSAGPVAPQELKQAAPSLSQAARIKKAKPREKRPRSHGKPSAQQQAARYTRKYRGADWISENASGVLGKGLCDRDRRLVELLRSRATPESPAPCEPEGFWGRRGIAPLLPCSLPRLLSQLRAPGPGTFVDIRI